MSHLSSKNLLNSFSLLANANMESPIKLIQWCMKYLFAYLRIQSPDFSSSDSLLPCHVLHILAPLYFIEDCKVYVFHLSFCHNFFSMHLLPGYRFLLI